jgi:glutamine synthetase
MKTKLEYIWIDGTEPTATLRSKTKIVDSFDGTVEGPSGTPEWGFDGSSTNQAPGDNSDCVLKPVRVYTNPLEDSNSFLVLCEVYTVDNMPHETNNRSSLQELLTEYKTEEVWVGMEQEYTLYHEGRPLGWPVSEDPDAQGDYYCGRNAGESVVRAHMDACIDANLHICGINAEVMLGQWEYQIGAENPLVVSDDLWVARWLMEKIAGSYDITVSLDPKPIEGDWNGAGCHTNFSTKVMREEGGDAAIHKAIKKLEYSHREHIEVYGDGNQNRLTGLHETCSINDFRWGVSDRGASVRVPWQVARDEKGYLEDRRPSANCDPYLVSSKLVKTICS